MSVDYVNEAIFDPPTTCQTSFDWASDKLSHNLFIFFSEKVKNDKSKVRTRATHCVARLFYRLRQLDICEILD